MINCYLSTSNCTCTLHSFQKSIQTSTLTLFFWCNVLHLITFIIRIINTINYLSFSFNSINISFLTSFGTLTHASTSLRVQAKWCLKRKMPPEKILLQNLHCTFLEFLSTSMGYYHPTSNLFPDAFFFITSDFEDLDVDILYRLLVNSNPMKCDPK